MSLNEIQLPGLVIAGLYKNSLITPGQQAPQEKVLQTSPGAYTFLGDNLKKIVLVVSSPDSVFLPEEHLLLLTKMLGACKLNIGDVAIINHFSTPATILGINQQLDPKVIILFGLEPTMIKLPFTLPAFKIQEYDGCNYLYTPALSELSVDTEEGKLLKSKLWVCLRKLFEV